MTDHDRGGSLDALSAEIGATFLSSLKGKNDLDEYEGSLAMTLLRSSDEKVVAAAKRIFFTALAKEETCLPSKVCQKTAFENKNRTQEVPLADEIPSSTLCLNGPILNTSSTASTDRSQIQIPKPTPTGFSIHVSKRSKSPTHKPISETKKKTAPSDRMERSRERNRMHARKTRQRKKEHMQCLRDRADELKQKHLQLRQQIKEKQTADILLVMGAVCNDAPPQIDAEVDALLKRPLEEIPDPSKIQELPTLYLPGQHNKKSRKRKNSGLEEAEDEDGMLYHGIQDMADDINYELLKKDRSKCTPAELDQIRRERNRMHAKRTRDRKRLFMEEMETLIKTLEEDNAVLERFWTTQNGNAITHASAEVLLPTNNASSTLQPNASSPMKPDVNSSCVIVPGALQSLLAAVDREENNRMSSIASAVSASPALSRRESVCDEEESFGCSTHKKRPCMEQRESDNLTSANASSHFTNNQVQHQQPLAAS